VLKLVERTDEKYFSLEESESRIEGAIRQEKNDARLKELLDQWKKEVGVVIYDDNLDKTQIKERPTPATPASEFSAVN
jgi:hypothetical protein